METGDSELVGARGLGRDAAWLYVNLLLSAGTTIVALAYAIRRVGTEDYGLFVIITATAALLNVVDSGFGTTVVRSLARALSADADFERDVSRSEALAAHAVLAAVGAVVIVGSLPAAVAVSRLADARGGRVVDLVVSTLIVGAAAGLGLATAALPNAARGAGSFRTVGLGGIAGAVARLATVFVLVPHVGVVGLALAQLAAVATERTVEARWVRAQLPWFGLRPRRPQRPQVKAVVTLAVPLVILGIDSQLVASSDALVIGAIVGAQAVAIYRVGSLLPGQAFASLLRAFSVTFPKLAGTDVARDQMALVEFFTRVVAYVAGVGFMCGVLFRQAIVRLLLGHDNHDAQLILVMFCVACALDVVPHGLVTLLIARGRAKAIAVAAPAELVLNLSLTVILVARYGMVGAGITALTTFAFMDFVVLPAITRREFTPGTAHVLVVDGLMPLAAGALVAVASTAVVRFALGPSLAQLTAGATVAALVGGAVGLILLGPSGRTTLRAAVSR